ncbi:neuronal acetylcholine receptor subunit alpha-7-like [Montipora foliosa]|uniref:neuronal acetylcholine receptor subunit alpha-7-like n=1 Tax=Montipora foliosa TaxID=591990 RepID=UPI0035F10A88
MASRRLRARQWSFLMLWLLALVLAAEQFKRCQAQINRTRIEKTLIDALFKDYDREVRPVLNQSQPVLVKFGFAYANLHSLDAKTQVLTSNVWIRQQWGDAWLTWDPSKYEGLRSINVNPDSVWKPDIFLHNSVNDAGNHGEQYLFNTKLIVDSNGIVTWFSPDLIKTSCKINIKYFPWDTQTCKFKFGSWTYHRLKLDMDFYEDFPSVDLTSFTVNGEWKLVSVKGTRNVVYYGCCKEPFTDITFEIKIERRSLFYINNLVFPCIVLALLTATAFLFPPETGERISLTITVLLGMTVFMIVVVDATPPTSDATPIITTYFSVVMVEISLALLCTCISLNIEHRHPKVELTGWFRFLLFDVLGPVLSRRSVMAIKQKRNNNMGTKKLDGFVKGNQVVPQDDKIANTDICQQEVKIAKTVEKEIRVAGMDTVTKFIEDSHLEDRRKLEWHVAVNIVDNLFFLLFIVTIIISSLVLLIPHRE